MNVAVECNWQHRSGRDREGNQFSTHLLIHGSGRILARVVAPCADEYCFTASFWCKIPVRLLRNEKDLDFIELEAAKAFVEHILNQCEPLADSPRKSRRSTSPKEKVQSCN